LITVLIGLYAGLNLLAAGAFAYDKYVAGTGRRRVPERTLLLLAFAGPFGAFGSMVLIRHKTRKLRFWLVKVFLTLHIAGIVYLLFRFSGMAAGS